jgi:hypothetical protein
LSLEQCPERKPVNPSLSGDPRDELLAALNWPTAKFKRSADYGKAPMCFDACLEWHQRLSEDVQKACRTLADVIASAHKAGARKHGRVAAACATKPSVI